MIVLIVIVFVIAIIVAVIVFSIQGAKGSMRVRKKADDLGAKLSGTLKHISGLPIPPNAEVDMYCCPNKFVFVGSNQEITVARTKVISVDRITGRGDPSKQMSDAAAGMLLFGVAGAAIGAMSSGTTCLVITYKSNDENKFIVLDGTHCMNFVKKTIKEFSQGSKNAAMPTKVDL
ncbi:MAG: hypothetical protein LUD72_11935 [Bacteroidales bacterium]|nr:hypothetical protein [Bacteroidales bacterium]